jgi:hypothetical protein
MKCYQCEKPAMFVIEQEGTQVPLCLDCNLKFTRLIAEKNDMLERGMNYLTSMAEAQVGLPGLLPRFPERRVVKTGDITLNNIKIDNSTVGVVNTGNIETVDAAVTSLKQSENPSVSAALLAVAEAVLTSTQINTELKNHIVEILSVVATEATAPKERRRNTAMRPLLSELATLLSGIGSLSQLWDRYKSVFESLFQ